MTPISNTTKEDFINWLKVKRTYWLWLLLPKYFKLVFIQLFSHETLLKIEINYWHNNGFDWSIIRDLEDDVIMSDRDSSNYYKTYNEALFGGIEKFNELYNKRYETK